MKLLILLAMLVQSAFDSLGQQAETERKLFVGTMQDIRKTEPFIDSLLSYPGNKVGLDFDYYLSAKDLLLKRRYYKKYALVVSSYSDSLSLDILKEMYKTALYHAKFASLSHKRLSNDLLSCVYSCIKYRYKRIVDENRQTNEAVKQKQQFVELAHRCQDVFFRYCFRYLVDNPTFYLYRPFIDSVLVEQLRYSLKHPHRTADEVAIAVQCRDENLYFVEDTLRCPLLPDSRICRDLEYLKWKSKEKKVSVDSLIARTNREERATAHLYAEKLDNTGYQQYDFRLRVLKMLDETPIKALAGEVERYGKSYENLGLNWIYTLAKLGYKDYVDRYANSVDSLLKLDEGLEDQQWRYEKARNILANLIKIGRTDKVVRFAPLLLCKSFMQGFENQTRVDFQAFLLLRYYLPELYSYGQERFVAHCRSNLIGFKYESLLQEDKVPIALKPSRGAKKKVFSCEEVYSLGYDRDYLLYPDGFFGEMYEWMVSHKGTFKLNNTTKMFSVY